MKLLIQPGEGVAPLVKAINDAKSSVQILIFRFDRAEVETALVKAVTRGISVRALIAYTNRGGEKSLRALEMRLLGAGVTVARTDGDLIRYHGKMMIVDDHDLYLLAYNFTHQDMERSRSFAVITDDEQIVQEAVALFDADSRRVPYTPSLDTFVVSPINSRKLLSDFIKRAEEELLIYDPAVTDPAMLRVLNERSKAGVKIRVIGRASRKLAEAEVRPLFMRLHTRAMVRDGTEVFLGSQSLRTAEMDARREIGLIFDEPKIAARISQVFNDDWQESSKVKDQPGVEDEPRRAPPVRKVAKKVAKAVVGHLPPVSPVLDVVVRELAGTETEVLVNREELEETVKDAVKDAIQQAVASAVGEALEEPE